MWRKARLVAVNEHAHDASIKGISAGSWPFAASEPLHLSFSSSSIDAKSPSIFATAGMDGVARVWRLVDGKVTERLRRVTVLEGHSAGVRAVALPPPHRPHRPTAMRLGAVTTSYDATVRLWYIGDKTQRCFVTQPLRGHAAPVLAATIAPNGKVLATGGEDGRVCLWSLSDSKDSDCNLVTDSLFRCQSPSTASPRPGTLDPIASVNVYERSPVRCVAWSTDECAATGGEDGSIRVWSKANGGGMAKCVFVLAGHFAAVTSIALCPRKHTRKNVGRTKKGQDLIGERSRLLAGCDEGFFQVWRVDVRDEKKDNAIATLTWEWGDRAHVGTVRCALLFTTDAGLVVSSSEDRTVRLWDLQSGECVNVLLTGSAAAVECVSFSFCGYFLGVGIANGSLQVWRDDTDNSPAADFDASSVMTTVAARIELGIRPLLHPHDFESSVAAESAAGTAVTSSLLREAFDAANEDALAALPRIDKAVLVSGVANVERYRGEIQVVRGASGALQTLCIVCHEWIELKCVGGGDGRDLAMPLPCGHIFHRSCILPWLLNSTTCPTCRASVFKTGGIKPTACTLLSKASDCSRL
ncbi:WD40 repeat-containing protein [Micromonas pusilla CCMP1545]|jgi:WD40 repeat protein|uniref:WD40 repeat-containing protein n=1 Tax=Micromonas pusilla (strain CCMP1545) TaxID=564608 RepID=C1MKF0_MICPC|nr:WD40 repeat-containing protein [Micromonas pusilla CCMP1545]EEH59749.1 WD40 repeat-containing protein [Micromonas pusilla CCMP1545]|mmetsp:Transcript_9657/g.35138  ORF Transcript_9657/g.35138 Transcript_9657/m.35138 type:complete len:583 (+) Transcript_9657:233-1981(+)|eukprot:XP_003056373.1 WD40 repeat-containing protein [Micromonas pusilla CCMP1545]